MASRTSSRCFIQQNKLQQTFIKKTCMYWCYACIFGLSDMADTVDWLYTLPSPLCSSIIETGKHKYAIFQTPLQLVVPTWPRSSQLVISKSCRAGLLGTFWQKAISAGMPLQLLILSPPPIILSGMQTWCQEVQQLYCVHEDKSHLLRMLEKEERRNLVFRDIVGLPY